MQYQNPLTSRYATDPMNHLFSPEFKYLTWRKLWISLARAQKELGLHQIHDEMIQEMQRELNHIDFDKIRHFEKQHRHEVMAHIYAFGELCPNARKILHLGATSSFVMDNTDLIQMRDGANILKKKLLATLSILAEFAYKHASLPCLSYTHLQPAQPTTVGKRAALWLQDLLWDFHALENFRNDLPFLGVKGATGTQASFLQLFSKDASKLKKLEEIVASDFGFSEVLLISSQTYPRKIDFDALTVLASIATSIHKLATDLRLLMHMKEIEEPFEEAQIGSSAMPHKQNPIYAERLCSLSRFLISLWENGAYTASLQWLERSLDDSAGKRIYIPEAFLTADALLNLLGNVLDGIKINPQIIKKNLEQHLPSLYLESILMKATQKGKDRMVVHALLRTYAKEEKTLEEIIKDPEIGLSQSDLSEILDPKILIGTAPEQVEIFIDQEVNPLLKKQESFLNAIRPIHV